MLPLNLQPPSTSQVDAAPAEYTPPVGSSEPQFSIPAIDTGSSIHCQYEPARAKLTATEQKVQELAREFSQTTSGLPIDEYVEPQSRQCNASYCVGVTSLILAFCLGATGLVFGVIAASSNMEKELLNLQTNGMEGNCTFSHIRDAKLISCTYRPERTECSGSGSGGQSCSTIPASFNCECPIQYHFATENLTFSKVLYKSVQSFRQTSPSNQDNIDAATALQDYHVNVTSECLASSLCDRFSCFGDAECCLNLPGHPTGFSDYCHGLECEARVAVPFDCTLERIASDNWSIYGEHITTLLRWNEEHVGIFSLWGFILGILACCTALFGCGCCSKHRKKLAASS